MDKETREKEKNLVVLGILIRILGKGLTALVRPKSPLPHPVKCFSVWHVTCNTNIEAPKVVCRRAVIRSFPFGL
jgi:hypothetical protein